jgi:ABC-type Fe3+-hydroxamate transport system substrate-binding protein
MIQVRDQLGDIIHLVKAPKRIVSLVPSQTELLYDLGLGDRVVGITKFCIHPDEWFRNKERIGGTKNVKIDKIRSLNPDLIIGNKEENTLEDIEKLRAIAPVWMSDIFTLKDAYDMIKGIGEVCNVPNKSQALINKIQHNFAQLKLTKQSKNVLYLIWKDPYMAAAENTFINHIITQQLGLENVLKGKKRYPVVEPKEIESPNLIFLSSEPYPFKEKHITELENTFPNATVVLVDGEFFTWYGSRLLNAPSYFDDLLNRLELH